MAGRLAALKTRLLPILIPARGVNGEVWVADALQVFCEAGVNLQNPIDGPLLPAPAGESGAFLGRSMMSSEVSAMLRSFLGVSSIGPDENAPLFSSHRLKATTLAWAARYGLSPATRSLLGRHTSCLNETFSVYSRDLMVSPVVELQRVIDGIASGNFSPDEQRSRFFGAVNVDDVQANPDATDGDKCIDVDSVKSQQCCEMEAEVPLKNHAMMEVPNLQQGTTLSVNQMTPHQMTRGSYRQRTQMCLTFPLQESNGFGQRSLWKKNGMSMQNLVLRIDMRTTAMMEHKFWYAERG